MITLVEGLALAIIAWHALCGLNHMSRATSKPLVLAVAILFAGCVARAYGLLQGYAEADISTTPLLVAFAIGMLIERRRSETCPCLPNLSRGRSNRREGVTT